MRIVYADSGIHSDVGHHANSCRVITGELRARGIEPTVLTFEGTPKPLCEELKAIPHFRADTYWRTDGDPICGWMNAFYFGAEIIRQDLARISDLGAGDLLYFNSVQPAQMMGILNWMFELSSERLPQVVVEFGTEPGLDMQTGPNGALYVPRDPRRDARATLFRFAAFRIPKHASGKLHFMTFEKYCSSVYEKLLNHPVEVFPLPFQAKRPLRSRAGKRPITVSVLGHQRGEKGYQHVPEVAQQLLKSREDIRFLAHNGAPADMVEQQESLRALRSREPRLTVDERAAGPQIWSELLDASDLILCPYYPAHFHLGYSAVAAEAVAEAIPVIGPVNSSIDRLIQEYGGCGTTFEGFEPASIVEATARLLDRFDHYAGIARTGADKFARDHGPSKLVDRLLSLVQSGGAER